MSSSDSDVSPPKKVDTLQSDSDSTDERKFRKKQKREKLKEAKKLAKKMKKEDSRKLSPLPPKRDNTELMDMDICETPPHGTIVSHNDNSFARSTATSHAKGEKITIQIGFAQHCFVPSVHSILSVKMNGC